MKKIILVILTITTGQLFAQRISSKEASYTKELDRFGIALSLPDRGTEIHRSVGMNMNNLFAFPLSENEYELDTPRSRIVYTAPRRYAFGDNDLPRGMVKADRIRYLIGYNINSVDNKDTRLDIEYLIGNKNKTMPFQSDQQISFIETKDAKKRFNADSALVYTLPIEGAGDFKYCTSLVLFKNPMTLNILLFLSEKEIQHLDKHLATLNKTIWFSDNEKAIQQREDSKTYEASLTNTALSERVLEKLKQSRGDSALSKRILENMRLNENKKDN